MKVSSPETGNSFEQTPLENSEMIFPFELSRTGDLEGLMQAGNDALMFTGLF